MKYAVFTHTYFIVGLTLVGYNHYDKKNLKKVTVYHKTANLW